MHAHYIGVNVKLVSRKFKAKSIKGSHVSKTRSHDQISSHPSPIPLTLLKLTNPLITHPSHKGHITLSPASALSRVSLLALVVGGGVLLPPLPHVADESVGQQSPNLQNRKGRLPTAFPYYNPTRAFV